MSDDGQSGTHSTAAHGTRRGRTLEAIACQSGAIPVIRKRELSFGDRVFVRTRNSLYSLLALGDGTFVVNGGWFDKQALAPATVAINGCTFGGSAICCDLVAGRGLFLEFSNNVCTTRIQSVHVERSERSPEPAPE